uniref:Uncharacterized protein n=1 Tax=Arion vulgaris TaxID=1028688 RepID=A0A0B6ZX24_9EUPU
MFPAIITHICVTHMHKTKYPTADLETSLESTENIQWFKQVMRMNPETPLTTT